MQDGHLYPSITSLVELTAWRDDADVSQMTFDIALFSNTLLSVCGRETSSEHVIILLGETFWK